MEPMPQDSEHSPKKKRRQRKHRSGHEQHMPHPDEKWLVSYSDMMTLLFGLFVMLYSIAMEKQGDPNSISKVLAAISGAVQNQIQQISDVTPKTETSTATSAPLSFAATSAEQLQKLNTELSQSQNENQQLNLELEKARAELLEAQARNEETLRQISESQTAQSDALGKLQDQQREKQKISKELKALSEANAERLKKTQDDLTKAQAEVAAVQEKAAASEAELENLQKKLADLETQNQKELQRGKNILLMARWNQEKYDLDLEVKDPQGRLSNFRSRNLADGKLQFLADATQGPGSEIVRVNSSLEGTYEMKVKIYNNRGEVSPVQVDLVALTADGEVQLKKIELSRDKGSEQKVPVRISLDGSISAP